MFKIHSNRYIVLSHDGMGVHTLIPFVLYYTVDIGPEKNEMLNVSRGFAEQTLC